MEKLQYWLCFGGAGFVGASAEDLEPEIHYGTREEAGKIAEDMCINAYDSYGVEEGEGCIETEYSDCYVELLSQREYENWSLKDKLLQLVKDNGHNWEDVSAEYGLED